MSVLSKIALGGGCHWCTEAVFQSLKGVEEVKQGFVASEAEHSSFSEAVIVHFYPREISLFQLIEVHLMTHQSSSLHSMRYKYRSAIYTFDALQEERAKLYLTEFKKGNSKIITEVLAFKEFKASREEIQNYYLKGSQKPFCTRYISPKLKSLEKNFKDLLA
ncbi:peptide-methionine (S)-S-oxide reductase [Mesonia ostreae]|uniref:peptide-methionine (S)-S-oxide reductase n=1 Tax=Mesonia ostreae TaxID=861110 RepID=A0ABU2KHX5_9FLAO|nr:peptide-methionine (S)-S-oxide reductase [Mesonia ostreae]MDT0294279.1 peptide-methionine (S)-S-oxide reductase [Mesonia ostreae]